MATANNTTVKLGDDVKAPVLALYSKGQKAGMLQSSEVLGVLEKLDIDPEQIEHIYDTIEALGIQIVGAELDLDAADDIPVEEEELVDPSAMTSMCYAEITADDHLLQEALEKAETVVVLSQSVSQNEEIIKVIDQAKESGKKTVLISLNLPYDAACYENTDAVLCAYQPYGSAYDENGNGPFNLNVAVALCTAFGQSVPSGTLPVNVPEITVNGGEIAFEDEYLYSRGAGLANWGK